eukprot:Phypoly_transcript_20356.p1 GENE.Phypoly_transcript_20356~~Phypoly_transcript_20356.p1  ORF type:complete len:129 (+),score=18.72 Phypoly_transcript_20356:38-388(+)
MNFDLLDDDLKHQLDELAAQARLQARQGGPLVSEVGDVPEDELERVDADSFRPTKHSTTEQVIQYLALKPELQGCKVSIAQKKPGFFAGGDRLPVHWSIVVVVPASSHTHSHNHQH